MKRLQTTNPDNLNVETWEGYVNQLNLLLDKGMIDEKYYVEDIERTNKGYDINLYDMFKRAQS